MMIKYVDSIRKCFLNFLNPSPFPPPLDEVMPSMSGMEAPGRMTYGVSLWNPGKCDIFVLIR